MLLSAVLDDQDPIVQRAIVKVFLKTVYLPKFTEEQMGSSDNEWIEIIKVRDALQLMIMDFISPASALLCQRAIRIVVLLRDRRAVPAIIQTLANRNSLVQEGSSVCAGHIRRSTSGKAA